MPCLYNGISKIFFISSRKALPIEGENIESALRAILEDRGDPKSAPMVTPGGQEWSDWERKWITPGKRGWPSFQGEVPTEMFEPSAAPAGGPPGPRKTRTPQEYMDWFRQEYPEQAR